jgi:hypothetical protein
VLIDSVLLARRRHAQDERGRVIDALNDCATADERGWPAWVLVADGPTSPAAAEVKFPQAQPA